MTTIRRAWRLSIMFRDPARLGRAPNREAQTKKPGPEAELIASILP